MILQPENNFLAQDPFGVDFLTLSFYHLDPQFMPSLDTIQLSKIRFS